MGEAGLLFDNSLSVRTLTMCLSYLFTDRLQEGLRKPDCLLKARGPFSYRFPAVSQ